MKPSRASGNGRELTRIAMWSGPRNLSTAMMRSWENRPDTAVIDEPFYAHYLKVTGLDHPMRDEIIAAGPVVEAEAIARCLAVPDGGRTVSYQKHMTHHLLPSMDRSWLDEVHNVLLIRHPARVLASYTRKRAHVTLADIGLPQQLELFERFEERLPIIDSDDFLDDPPSYLALICDLVDLTFDERMLTWVPGPRDSDGVWATHWYDAVWASTGFAAANHLPLPELPTGLRSLVSRATEIYDELWSNRLVL